MTTPLLMLALLTGPYFFLGHVQAHLAGHPTSPQTRAAIGVATMFTFTGVGHFVATEAMVQMLPTSVSFRAEIVYVSGALEIVLAVMVLVPALRRPTGWLLIAMLVGFVPVNMFAAFARVPMGGHAWGPVYLLVRIPLQAFIAAWIWWFLVTMRHQPDCPEGERDAQGS
jgi:uncharacterized membrane protein